MIQIQIILMALILTTFHACSTGDKNDQSKSKNLHVNPLPQSEVVQYQQCQSDDDCIYVNNGCCDCANSGFIEEGDKTINIKPGEEIAINRSKIDEFKARFSCKVNCTERDRIPNCGEGTVSCQNNLCHFEVKKTE